MKRTTPSPVTSRPLAAAIIAIGIASGCAASRPRFEYSWPPPPEKTRVEAVRAFRSQRDLDPTLLQRVLSVLVPQDSRASITAPSSLALSVDERRLYVGCGSNAKVIVVDLDDRTMKVLASGDENAPASSFGLAVDGDDNVYVSDRVRNAVMVYDRKGKFLRKIGVGVLEEPAAIAIDRPGQQLYVLNGTTRQKTDHRIEVYSLKGERIRTLGKRGEGPGEFNFPSALAVDRDRKLYVADKLNFRVQVLDADGRFLEQFGEIGRGRAGVFDKIRGMAFDSFGNFYLVDTMQGVHVLNPKRRALMLFASPPLTTVPYNVAIDSRNRIYLADFGQNAILELQLVNTTAEESEEKRPAEPIPASTSAPAPAPASP